MKYKPTIIVMDSEVEADQLESLTLMREAVAIHTLYALPEVQGWLSQHGVLWDSSNSFEVVDFEPAKLPFPCCIVAESQPNHEGEHNLISSIRANGLCIPIIFTSSQGTIANVVASAKLGAVDFLTKPIETEELHRSIHKAFEWDLAHRMEWVQCVNLKIRLDTLSEREREVLRHLCRCKSIKQIARLLGTSPNTIRNQRASIRRKMHTESDVELTEFLMLFRLYLEPCSFARYHAFMPRLEIDAGW